MVIFATLFLGLVFGSQSVELIVADEVEVVEIHLDGESVATLREPPWTVRVDLGEEPAPRLLEAIAYDGLFAELGRSSQWLNVPREPAELALAVERAEGGRKALARVTWDSVGSGEPNRVELAFDGRPVEIGSPAAIELPDHDPQVLHFVRAEAEFDGSLTASAEAVFGGTFGDETSSALTAIVIEAPPRRRVRAEHLVDSFRLGEAVLEVATVEKGVGEIVVVRSPAASAWVAALGPLRPWADSVSPSGPVAADPTLEWRRAWRAQMLWPQAQRTSSTGRAYDLFPHSQRLRPEDGELAALLRLVEAPALDGVLRIADAVAIAGLTAAAGGHRRIVLLIVGDADADSSELTPGMTRRLLARLGVPLEVWSVGSSIASSAAWGAAAPIGSGGDLEKATRTLLGRLERQRVAWLRGDHPPSRIELAGGSDISLAGRTPR